MTESVFQQSAVQTFQEWQGQTSAKFVGSRAHVPAPVFKEVPHPLYSTNGRRHFEKDLSDSYNWKPSIRVDPEKDRVREDRPKGTQKIDIKFTEMPPRAERVHLEPNPSGSYEDLEVGKKTFIMHNRKTNNEFSTESAMTKKKRVQTLYDQRNGVPISSLGDKIYKAPEYQTGFFKDGGLITGSTNAKKKRAGNNVKGIDFYAGLQLDKGPLNPGRKTWVQAVKEEQYNNELGDVLGLKNWERNVLKEVDPKYQVSDDEDDEKNVKVVQEPPPNTGLAGAKKK